MALLERDAVWTWADLVQPGYRYPGALAAIVFALPLAGRLILPGVSVGRLADMIVPALAFALATFRLGCLAVGCCFGTVSGLAWAVQFPAGSPASRSSTYHPTVGAVEGESLR
jgi:prolipoprotein diacylglyceryltransferase